MDTGASVRVVMDLSSRERTGGRQREWGRKWHREIMSLRLKTGGQLWGQGSVTNDCQVSDFVHGGKKRVVPDEGSER